MTGNDITGGGISLSALRERKAALLKDVEAIDNVINALEKLAKSGIMGSNASMASPQQANLKLVDISNLNVGQATIQLLIENLVPMKTREIVDGLKARGKTIDAVDPLTSVFSSLLSYSKKTNSRIKKLDSGVWGLADRD